MARAGEASRQEAGSKEASLPTRYRYSSDAREATSQEKEIETPRSPGASSVKGASTLCVNSGHPLSLDNADRLSDYPGTVLTVVGLRLRTTPRANLTKLRELSLLLLLPVLLEGCASHLSDLPGTSAMAFALPDQPRRDTTLMETFVVTATMAEALKAAEQAFESTGFERRPESWTADRRCAEYTLGWHEWPFWACMYFRHRSDTALDGRVIVESWTSFGVKTSQPWHLHLVTAFQNRLRTLQDRK